jgi:predicted CXXCH cytochrome family protein
MLSLALVGSASLWWRASRNTALLSQEAVADVPKAGRPGGYVSSDTCRACHPDQHASWRRTFHRTMTQAATPESVQALFAGQTLSTPREDFVVHQADGAYWTRITERADGAKSGRSGGEAMLRQIDMITGSHRMQVFWVDAGSGNMQLGFPFTWLIEDHRWVPRGDTFLRAPDSPPPMDLWNMSCLRCHSTAGQPRPDKVNRVYETRVAELGIACEACHGPAAAHVAANRNTWRRFQSHLAGKGDSTIVQPARLDHVRSSQVCGNCHSMKWFEANDHWARNGFDYLPGQDLEARTPILRPLKEPDVPALRAALKKRPEMISEYFWPDGMIRVSGREFNGLIESPCYQKGTMGCLSCHSMHQSNPVSQLAAGKEGNEACLVCHTAMRGRTPAHTHHPADSAGSLCYNCHMPHTTYGLLKAIRSHQIDSPSAQASLDTGRPNACNLCHLDKTLSWAGENLKKWYGQRLPTFGAREQSVSAAILWAMKGDAGQRALTAWSLGWKPALEASGESWIAPYLGRLLDDPYAAVRYAAQRSLKSLPGFAGFGYDYVGPPDQRAKASRRAVEQWRKAGAARLASRKPETLMNTDGSWREKAVDELQALRDDRPVHLRE